MPKIIADWKHSWKYPSVNIPALVLAVQGVLAANPHALDFVPDHWRHAIIAAGLVWAAYDRLTTHPPAPAPNP